ncbi:MAG: hypothetical protein QOE71_3074, partial [Pseudonocardiales bacterium]|nr:hypothetical protein [Pseudonocardiales bacterium]
PVPIGEVTAAPTRQGGGAIRARTRQTGGEDYMIPILTAKDLSQTPFDRSSTVG